MTEQWRQHHPKGSYVRTKEELFKVDRKNTEHVLGLFSWDHLPYDDELKHQDNLPSLVNMTSVALDLLLEQSQDHGFFLMVEGGRIDHANHYALATRALSETVAMDRAVEEILRRVSLEETLIIVTADHSHTLSVSGQLIFEGKSPLNILYQHFIYFKNMVNGIIVTIAGGYR